MNKSITMMVPAYNEEKRLEETVKIADKTVKGISKDYEILIFDDCSSDRTGAIADMLARKNPKIKVIHNKKNMGLGYNYRKCIKIARKEYFGWLPGDNDIYTSSIKNILRHVGEADIIIPFVANKKVKTMHRRVISSIYTGMLNLLFGLHIKYYNGVVIHKTRLLRKVKMRTDSFAFQAEILVQLLRKGHSYKEVPMNINGVKESSMFRLKNLMGVLKTITRLFFEEHFG